MIDTPRTTFVLERFDESDLVEAVVDERLIKLSNRIVSIHEEISKSDRSHRVQRLLEVVRPARVIVVVLMLPFYFIMNPLLRNIELVMNHLILSNMGE